MPLAQSRYLDGMITTAAEDFSTADAQSNTFVPPYISFAQLANVLERMRNEGVPARIDRSYLASWSGSAQAQFLKATANLELRDEHGRPTDLLKRLVAEPEGRPGIVGQMLNDKYPSVIALGADATQQQLEEEFRKFEGIQILTTGGPGIASTPLNLQIYNTGLLYQQIGYAAAMGVLLVLLIGVSVGVIYTPHRCRRSS